MPTPPAQECLFRITGSRRRDPAVDAWLAALSEPLAALAQHWFAIRRNCGKDVREVIHDGCPVACVEDVPFGYVNVFQKHVNVGFYRGADLPDPSGILLGTGKRMRHVKLMPTS